MIKERLEKLRSRMRENNIHYYIIPTNDYHLSEYVGEYFGARKYMSGFTGSAGVLLVGLDQAGLWTDGRYYIQAERQLEGSTITLFKQGSEGVPSMEDYLKSILKDGEARSSMIRILWVRSGRTVRSFPWNRHFCWMKSMPASLLHQSWPGSESRWPKRGPMSMC